MERLRLETEMPRLAAYTPHYATMPHTLHYDAITPHAHIQGQSLTGHRTTYYREFTEIESVNTTPRISFTENATHHATTYATETPMPH